MADERLDVGLKRNILKSSSSDFHIVVKFLEQDLTVNPQKRIRQLLKVPFGEEKNEIFCRESYVSVQCLTFRL